MHDPITEEVSSKIVARINGLMESAKLFRFSTRHSLELVAKQLGMGKQAKNLAPQQIIVSDSRLTPIRGLNRDQAATYIGVSASKFDELIHDGRMPAPKRIDGRVVWDKRQIDKYFDRLPGGDLEDPNPWDVSP